MDTRPSCTPKEQTQKDFQGGRHDMLEERTTTRPKPTEMAARQNQKTSWHICKKAIDIFGVVVIPSPLLLLSYSLILSHFYSPLSGRQVPLIDVCSLIKTIDRWT